jgi:hypothetical protein
VLRHQTIHAAVCPLHPAIGSDGNNRVLHAVEQSFEFSLICLQSGEAFFQLAGSFIEGTSNLSNFIHRGFGDARGQISARDLIRKSNNATQAACGVLGGERRDQQSSDKGQYRAEKQCTAYALCCGLQI